MIVSWRTRMLVSVFAIISMLAHSGGETASLVGIAAGGTLLLLGLWTMFRVAAIGGFLISVGVSAHFTVLETMTEAQGLLFASIALFVPALAIGWAALTAEDEHEYVLDLKNRQVASASLFAIACMASVPVAMTLSALIAPSVTLETSTMLEIAIVLVAAAAPAIYVFTREPERVETGIETPESE